MRSSLTSFVTLSRSLNLSGLLSLQAWPSAARLTGESIEGAGLDDGARRNTGLPSSVRCSCLEDAGSASPMPPWWGRCVLCKGDVVWWFLTQHRWGPGEQGFLLSVSSTVMGLWCIWVCWGLSFDAENSLVCEPHVPPPFLLLCKQALKRPTGQALSPAGHLQRGRTLLPLLA